MSDKLQFVASTNFSLSLASGQSGTRDKLKFVGHVSKGEAMAIVTIPDQNRTLQDREAITGYLAGIGIDYERWDSSRLVAPNATAEEVLAAYADEIERLKARGGYVTADVIDVNSQTPGLEAMLAKFKREHWH